jgi:enolase-phosphatase E1
MIRALLLDIEGTVCPISFVQNALFPYARARLDRWVRAHPQDPLLDEVARLAELEPQPRGALRIPALAAVLGAWSDADQKITPLKSIQGRIWREGFDSGALVTPFYADVPGALEAWRKAGATIAIYSSGSIEAQRLLFGHATTGDLTPHLSAYFDTTTGPKREAASYAAIAKALRVEPAEILFCTDIAEEAQAAEAAGLRTRVIAREAGDQLPTPG